MDELFRTVPKIPSLSKSMPHGNHLDFNAINKQRQLSGCLLFFSFADEPCLPMQLPAIVATETESLNPVIRILESEARIQECCLCWSFRWQQVRIDRGIDLIPRSNHIAPVDKRVACCQSKPLRQLISNRRSKLRHNTELISSEAPDIRSLSKQTAIVRRSLAILSCLSVSCDGYRLSRIAKTESHQCL